MSFIRKIARLRHCILATRLYADEEIRRSVDLQNLEGRLLFDAALGSIGPVDDIGIAVEATQDANLEQPAEPQLIAPLSANATSNQVLAFPGAEGMGAYAVGGRGGDVYHVTNLNDSGAGSLRFGIENMTSPRTIVFDVGGTIELETRLSIEQPYLTIAGQTAPGEGITISGQTVTVRDTNDIILRYLRIRPGDHNVTDAETHDGLQIVNSNDVIGDHLSLSWGIDEVFSTTDSYNVTLQWSIVSEGLSNSLHPKGRHGFGSLNTRSDISFVSNLFAHHDFRMPKIKGGNVEIVNNVFYNWSQSFPTSVGSRNGSSPLSNVNIENNIYIAGPSIEGFDPTVAIQIQDGSSVWASGNLIDGNLDGIFNSLEIAQLLAADESILVSQRFEFSSITIRSPELAYQMVLDGVGASLARDTVDTRVIDEVRNQSGTTIDSPDDVGGLVFSTSFDSPLDSDRDGIPDYWENATDYLDANNSADGGEDIDGDGFTNLEDFLNFFTFGGSQRIEPPAPTGPVSSQPNQPLGITQSPFSTGQSSLFGGRRGVAESSWFHVADGHGEQNDDDEDEAAGNGEAMAKDVGGDIVPTTMG